MEYKKISQLLIDPNKKTKLNFDGVNFSSENSKIELNSEILNMHVNDETTDDITKKQYWENDIESAINNSSFIKNINKIFCPSDNFTNLNNQE